MNIKIPALSSMTANLIVWLWSVSTLNAAPTLNKAQDKTAATHSETGVVYPLEGWSMAEKSLQEFEASLDRSISYTGKSSCQLRSLSAIATAGVMRQTLTSNAYHSRRIRLSGFLKTELTDGWAGLWMRIEGENGARLGLDNMQTRPVKGMTDWRKYEVVLDVPADSLAVSFGFFLAGKGRIWADDFALEAVGNEVSVTEVYGKKKQATEQPEQTKRQEAYARRLKEELKTKPTKPMNMNFEEPE